MEEGSTTVRLVRCPNCENLLHELPDYSVYQCGGCGAVLRAKKETMSGGLSEKRDDMRVSGGSENGRCLSVHSASETQNKKEGNDFDQNRKRNPMTIRLNQSNLNREIGDYMDKHRESLKCPISNRVNEDDHDINMNIMTSKLVNLSVENALEKIRPPIGNSVGSLQSRPVMDQSSLERKIEEHGRDSTSPYTDEGPSNHHPRSFRGYSEQMRIHNDLDGPSRVENLENDRAEILRKLDELQDQLNRSSDVAGKPKERGPVDTKTAPPPPLSGAYRVNDQPSANDNHAKRPLYFHHNNRPISDSYSHGLDMQGFYPPPRNAPKEFLGYEDFYMPPMLGRPPHQPPSQYLEQPYHDHFLRKRSDFNQVNLVSSQYETYLHQPAYSYLQWHKKNLQIPSKIPPLGYRRSQDDPNNPILYHHVDPVTRGPWGYNSRGANPPRLHSRDWQPRARTTSDLNSDTGGFGYHHPRRVVVAHGNGRVCHPIVGGAPFVTCCNCFVLLKLPTKLLATRKKQMKVRCGACFTILLVELEKKGLLVSNPVQIKQTLKSSHDYLDPCPANSYSEDFQNSGFNFQLTEVESNFLLMDQRLNFSKSDKKDPLSSSSNFSKNEQSPDSVIVRRDVSNSAELSSKDNSSVPVPDYSPQEQPDYSSTTDGKEKMILHRSTSQQNSGKDVAVKSEVEVPLYGGLSSSVSQDYVEVSKEECLNTGVSQDYVEVSEDHRARINKGSKSFFIGLIKKSFRDFSRSSQNVEGGRSRVYVNGQLIPDHEVKKAEKMAGTIQPGEYWYDFRAGFWGVLGQPCLGIIPPFIEEFNYPMPENCRGGNTSVFVNGRELHQNDLDLLSCRGLPTTREKSYLINISGRVFDQTTCKELDSLGKLAPTVERVKHGFGMKDPRAVAQ